MTLSEAKNKAFEYLTNVSKTMAVEDGWVFFDNTKKYDGAIVITKTGKKMSYSEYLMKKAPK